MTDECAFAEDTCCRALTEKVCRKGAACSFRKTAEQLREEWKRCTERLIALGRDDLIKFYGLSRDLCSSARKDEDTAF